MPFVELTNVRREELSKSTYTKQVNPQMILLRSGRFVGGIPYDPFRFSHVDVSFILPALASYAT